LMKEPKVEGGKKIGGHNNEKAERG
jgi:hypothetical protein